MSALPFFLDTSGAGEDLQALAADQEPKSAGFHEVLQSLGTHSQEGRQKSSGNSLVPLFHPESLSEDPLPLSLPTCGQTYSKRHRSQ